MKILFIHQNFPGQFKYLAPALAKRGHTVIALTLQSVKPGLWNGVQVLPYKVLRGSTPGVHPWVVDLETKAIRAEACFRACLELKTQGFSPDVVVAHPGWGESLFIKDIWPTSRLGIYCEFYYLAKGADTGFDAEFLSEDPADICRLAFKNINNHMHFDSADAGISPTHWQASTFPMPFRQKITVVHDGIDTEALAPNRSAQFEFKSDPARPLLIKQGDPVITFVNRNLEPYRGYHIFMRALPRILSLVPNANVIVVGGSGVSYGAQAPSGTSWKERFIQEVRPQIGPDDWARVHFLGNLPYEAFIKLLQVSQLHVYLTYPFVLSWSLLEAMAAGACILGSDTTPLHEAITHGQTGELVDFFDVQGLAESTARLMKDGSLRSFYSQAAREFAIKNYDLKTVCLPRQIQWAEGLADL